MLQHEASDLLHGKYHDVSKGALAYTKIDPESGYTTETKPPYNWPREGRVIFQDLSLVYYPGEPEVLKTSSFKVKAGEKLGIAGRTRCRQVLPCVFYNAHARAAGEIVIDSLNVQQLDLPSYRSRISVISQNPVRHAIQWNSAVKLGS